MTQLLQSIPPIATQAEMEAGTEANRRTVSPLLVAQAIAALGADPNNLGYYADETALTTAHPTADAGNFAILGSTDTVWVWDAGTVAWVDTNNGAFGDMLKATYDPGNVASDAFDMENMIDGATKVAMTDAERTLLATFSALDLADSSAGAMIAYDNLGVAQYVADGSAGSFLKSTGGDLPEWGGVAATELAAATPGDMIAYDAGGAAQYVAAGTAGQVLESTGADLPQWVDPSGSVLPESTGIKTGGAISIGTGGAGVATSITIAAGTAQLVDNTVSPPTVTAITWEQKTDVAITNILTQLVTFIAIDSGGTVIQSATDFTPAQQRLYVVIGVAVHSNQTTVNAVNQTQIVAYAPGSQANDLMYGIGAFNVSGNTFSANGANLKINKSAGSIFRRGANYTTLSTNPNIITTASLTQAPLRMQNQTGAGGASVTDVDVANYDLAGVTTAVSPATRFTILRVFLFQSNLVAVQRGQALYTSLAEAKAAIQTEVYTTNSVLAANGLLRGFIVAQANATSLNDTAKVFFIDSGKFGGTAGVGGLSVSTLQNAYNNSSDPEILTDATRGALTVKRGSAADTDTIIEGQNNAGTPTFSVTGNGVITGVLTNATGLPTAGMVDAAVTLAKMDNLTGPTVIGRESGTGAPIAMTPAQAKSVASLIRKTATTIYKSVVSGTTIMPNDGTIPQITEGVQYTTWNFTPTQSDSVVNVVITGTMGIDAGTPEVACALFVNSGADAVQATYISPWFATVCPAFVLKHSFSPGSVSQITFELRFGRVSATGTAIMPGPSTKFGTAGPQIVITTTEFAP